MATWIIIKDSCEPVPTPEGETPGSCAQSPLPDLEFPVAPEFVSRPPKLPYEAILRRCAETMAWRNARPGESQRRLAEKIDVEFVL